MIAAKIVFVISGGELELLALGLLCISKYHKVIAVKMVFGSFIFWRGSANKKLRGSCPNSIYTVAYRGGGNQEGQNGR